jgi:hypothetical protein
MRWFYDFVDRSIIGIASSNPCIYTRFAVVVLICFVSEGPISFPRSLIECLIHCYFQELILNRNMSEEPKG